MEFECLGSERMNKIAEEFAANLSKLRSNKGVSQAKLSLLCGFDKNYVGMLERAERRVTLEKVYIIAAKLECSVNDLMPQESASEIDGMIGVQ